VFKMTEHTLQTHGQYDATGRTAPRLLSTSTNQCSLTLFSPWVDARRSRRPSSSFVAPSTSLPIFAAASARRVFSSSTKPALSAARQGEDKERGERRYVR